MKHNLRKKWEAHGRSKTDEKGPGKKEEKYGKMGGGEKKQKKTRLGNKAWHEDGKNETEGTRKKEKEKRTKMEDA